MVWDLQAEACWGDRQLGTINVGGLKEATEHARLRHIVNLVVVAWRAERVEVLPVFVLENHFLGGVDGKTVVDLMLLVVASTEGFLVIVVTHLSRIFHF